jgi:glycosyltransferase involved in cell wall biosynthesis
MRYLYDLKGDYESGMGFFKKSIFRTTSHFLRQWDFVSAQRLDAVAVNSAFVGKRVKKYWSRDATVIAPPVAIENFLNLPIKDDGFYFLLTQLVPYKRVDLAIKIFNELKLPLVVAGEGSELKKCKELAGPTVRVLGSVPFEKVVELYTACRAFIFPGVEDFGIAPVEANACGKPVIALAQGGLLESQSAESALFFEDEEGFRQAVLTMEKEPKRFDASRIREHSKRFSEAEFLRQMRLWLRPYDSSFKVF